MTKQAITPATAWVANLTNPYTDQSYQDGDRPTSGMGLAKYSSQDIEIIQPQAGLTTTNRFYKQYTGLEYNVKVSVIGGDFSALAYSLTTAPSGMTINAATGEITWANPIEAGSPHSVTAEVTDGLTTDTVSWTVTVTTSGFLFIDSTVSTSGVGTIGDPMKLWTDFYLATEADSTYSGYFLIFRAGTHLVDSNAPATYNGHQWGTQKPVVMMAYPGETVTQDFSNGYIFADADCSNFYWDQFRCIDVGQFVAGADSGGVYVARLTGDNVTFRRNTFVDIADNIGSHNQAYIMSIDIGASTHDNWAITENWADGSDANAYALCILYSTLKIAIESNEIVNAGNIGIGPKTSNSKVYIRGNKAEGTGKLFWIYNSSAGLHEVSWNFGTSSGIGKSFTYNHKLQTATSSSYMFRNTFMESMYYKEVVTANAILYETDNVIVSTETYGHETGEGIEESRITKVGSLINSPAANFVSPTTGLLIDSYASQNATKGHNGLAGLK